MTLKTYAKCYANLRIVCVCYILKCRMTIHLSLLMMPIFQMLCIEICKLFKSSTETNLENSTFTTTTVYPKAAKRSILCAPLHSLNDSTVIIAAAELLAYN